MSLYIEASRILENVLNKTASVKTLVFGSQYQNKKQLFALVQECLKYSPILKQIVTNSKLLQREKLLKNNSALAQVLVYDFVIGKGLKQAAKLKQTILRNKTDILAQCERLKIKAKVDSLVNLLPNNVKTTDRLPRYVRVNYLKSTREQVSEKLSSQGWTRIEDVPENHESFLQIVKNLSANQYIQDSIIPDLLVFPAGTDLHENPLIVSRKLILQDKASCIPAHVLNAPKGSHIIDSCAAPGNKTSHVCSLIRNDGKIHAFDRDPKRLGLMTKLLKKAGATCVISACKDFLTVRTSDPEYKDVNYILVDPSCSGSGMVSRMNHMIDEEDPMQEDRLKKLSRFQISILKHALQFPNVKRVVYSTCSTHAIENEEVVEEVYRQVQDKFSLVSALPEWPERGFSQYENASLLCRFSFEKGLTNGFFVACFEHREVIDPIYQHHNSCGEKKRKSNSEEHTFSHVLDEDHSKLKTKKQKLSTVSKSVKKTEFEDITENINANIVETKQEGKNIDKVLLHSTEITSSPCHKMQQCTVNQRKSKKKKKKKHKPIA